MSEAVLSKKQQKALAFRAKQKQKAKGLPEPEDVPENDLVDDNDDAPEASADSKAKSSKAAEGKKRKRDDDAEAAPDDEGETTKDGKKAAKKGKTAWDDEEAEKKKTKKDIKQRFILFIGNLGYKTGREAVANHFKEAISRIPSVRLLTERAEPGKPAKSRGIAFLELATSTELQACLKLHHSLLNGREINVELTAGGGGKSTERKSKIAERNKRIGGQRERRADKEREAAIAAGEPTPEEKKAAERAAAEAAAPEGFKMRNGRRVKIKSGGGGRDGGYPARPKWQPTGANAVSVGQ